MPTWEELLIRTPNLDCQRLLSYWRWLLQKDYHPIVMTAFGDWFLLDDDGSVRGKAGTVTRAMNQAAKKPTHQVARKPISATKTRWDQPKSA